MSRDQIYHQFWFHHWVSVSNCSMECTMWWLRVFAIFLPTTIITAIREQQINARGIKGSN